MSDMSSSRARQRALGALWFGAWGVLAAGAVYLLPALDRRGMLDLGTFLYVLLPGLSALPAGALVGPAILDPARAAPWKAAGQGLLAAVLAHLVFAPLFALAMEFDALTSSNFLGLWMATTVLGIPIMGIITLPAGALAGWLLYLLGGGEDRSGIETVPNGGTDVP